MKSLFEEHFEVLQAQYPSARFEVRADGSRRVIVSDYPLPASGWNRSKTTVYFVVAPSYPMAQPDCFWTDPDLKLANGGPPQNTSVNNNHGGPENLLWFSWHASKWDANRDSLLTYLKIIDQRLRECR